MSRFANGTTSSPFGTARAPPGKKSFWISTTSKAFIVRYLNKAATVVGILCQVQSRQTRRFWEWSPTRTWMVAFAPSEFPRVPRQVASSNRLSLATRQGLLTTRPELRHFPDSPRKQRPQSLQHYRYHRRARPSSRRTGEDLSGNSPSSTRLPGRSDSRNR